MRKYASTDVIVLLLATKVDLVSARKISYDELQRFARDHKVPFIETSSKTGEGVHQAVHMAIKMKLYQLLSTNLTSPTLAVPSKQEQKVKENKSTVKSRKCILS